MEAARPVPLDSTTQVIVLRAERKLAVDLRAPRTVNVSAKSSATETRLQGSARALLSRWAPARQAKSKGLCLVFGVCLVCCSREASQSATADNGISKPTQLKGVEKQATQGPGGRILTNTRVW